MKKLVIVSLLFLVSCAAPVTSVPQEKPNLEVDVIYNDVYRSLFSIHDDKNDVTCWVWNASTGDGIHCIPDWQLEE